MKARENKVSGFSLFIKFFLPVCLILAGVAGWSYFKSQEPEMKRKRPKKQAVAVETIVIKPGNYQSSVNVMGIVMPDKKITLKAKISGEVVSISPKFVQGGIIKKGETLLVLDDSDYLIELKKVQSNLTKVLSDLSIEKGSQYIAKEELKLIKEASLTEIVATDLALRKPQLIKANAAVDSARADLDKAELNLSRTKITVPFNALILEKNIDLGSLVTVQGTLAILVDTDAFRVEALVPPDRMGAIKIDEKAGSRSLIKSQYSKQTWDGSVVRSTGIMNSKSRMAGVIIQVPDPFGIKTNVKKQPLLLDDHVEVQIFGQIFQNVFSIPRSILRDNNKLWIYNSGALEIKDVRIAWKEDGKVFVDSGIKAGDIVITSDLPAPVKGMVLQLASGERQ